MRDSYECFRQEHERPLFTALVKYLMNHPEVDCKQFAVVVQRWTPSWYGLYNCMITGDKTFFGVYRDDFSS